MLLTKRADFDGVADNSYIGRHALNTSTDWQAFTGGYIDDAGWVVLAIWTMADYKKFREEDNISAGQLYDKIAANWDDTCGGGVWWTTDHGYKNAITNELFLTLSARGYLRTGNQTYLENAKKVHNFPFIFVLPEYSDRHGHASGMRTATGLYNDGLVFGTCLNNNGGVIASGLAALAVATGNHTLFEQAEITLNVTIERLTVHGVLKESCDDPRANSTVCDIDQQTFKGIWTKHLQYYLNYAASARVTAKYRSILRHQSAAVLHYATNASLDIGSVWYAENEGGSVFSVKSLPSGIAAHVAAAQYGLCI
ncbi:glycoside hydrolase family 76 protein [Mycena polygramma]|nr:glycoside hydrolase family 76 protein [Mycena polygramma]